mgnify:CR=1 FL=1
MDGGVESVVMNYYRNIDRDKIQFHFLCDEDSTDIPYDEIERLGGKVIVIPPYQKLFKYQKELYSQGRTKPGKIVTNCDGYTHKSNHQAKSDGYGHAVDFAIYDPSIPGNIDWDNNKKYKEVAEHLKKVAAEMKISIEWGGDWRKFKDYPHIELK